MRYFIQIGKALSGLIIASLHVRKGFVIYGTPAVFGEGGEVTFSRKVCVASTLRHNLRQHKNKLPVCVATGL